MGGEFFGFLMDRLFEGNALDVWYTPIYMKKNRPAVQISVLCNLEHEEFLARILLEETTTLGVRSYSAERKVLERSFKKVSTPYGLITVKTAGEGEFSKAAPEFEDCKRAAKLHNVPLRAVYEEAMKAFFQKT